MVIEWDFMVVEWSLSHFPNSSGQIPILSIVTHKESPLFMVKHHFRCSNLRELRPRDAKWIHILSPCWAWPRAECLGIRGHVESCSTQQLWCDDPQWTRSVNVKCTVKVNCLLISINVYQCLSMSIKVYQYEKWYFTRQFVVIIHNSPPCNPWVPRGFSLKRSGFRVEFDGMKFWRLQTHGECEIFLRMWHCDATKNDM
jgi:hypothetical protein